jgi:alpha-glucosidase
MVTPNGDDVPWEGRDRLDVAAFERPPFDVQTGEREVGCKRPRCASRRGSIRSLEWSARGTARLADRLLGLSLSPKSGAAPLRSANPTTVTGWATRPPHRYMAAGRTPLDALGHDAETSDPQYKHWPYHARRDKRSGVRLFYDTLSSDARPAAQYTTGITVTTDRDGDLDYGVFVGPAVRDVVHKFAELTGRMLRPSRPGLREHGNEPY